MKVAIGSVRFRKPLLDPTELPRMAVVSMVVNPDLILQFRFQPSTTINLLFCMLPRFTSPLAMI